MSDTDFYAGPRFVLPDAVPVILPNRPLYLPRFYTVDKHSQCPDYDGSYGTIYIYLEDTEDRDRMFRLRSFTKTLKIPKGSKAYLVHDLGV